MRERECVCEQVSVHVCAVKEVAAHHDDDSGINVDAACLSRVLAGIVVVILTRFACGKHGGCARARMYV